MRGGSLGSGAGRAQQLGQRRAQPSRPAAPAKGRAGVWGPAASLCSAPGLHCCQHHRHHQQHRPTTSSSSSSSSPSASASAPPSAPPPRCWRPALWSGSRGSAPPGAAAAAAGAGGAGHAAGWLQRWGAEARPPELVWAAVLAGQRQGRRWERRLPAGSSCCLAAAACCGAGQQAAPVAPVAQAGSARPAAQDTPALAAAQQPAGYGRPKLLMMGRHAAS